MLVIYIILLIASLLFYILYVESFSFYLFAFLVSLPIILFIMLWRASKRVKVSFAGGQRVCVRGGRIPVVIRCENRCRYPISNLLIEIEHYNTIDSIKDTVKICTPLYPKEVQFLTMHLSSLHYGTIKLSITRCRISDMLRLFKMRLKRPAKKAPYSETSFTVIPNIIPIENPIANYSEMGLETDEYSKDHKGDDPSEIFDIHEYQEGDKINRIHWKLSAKQDTTMVKDYSLPIANSIIMVFYMNIDRKQNDFMGIYDAVVETVSAVTQYLSKNKTAHKVIWYDTITGENISMTIKDEEDSRLLISMLLRSGLYSDEHPALLNYVNSQDRFKCGHLMYFSANYDESVTSLMNDADLAFRYSYLLIHGSDDDNRTIADEFAEVVHVDLNNAPESIRELCL
ncbi:MAG: DUF58 domain-containing protein [Ruminococcus sp.]|nr:DUF58 domain-containing protein [Ruminococcus sp.]